MKHENPARAQRRLLLACGLGLPLVAALPACDAPATRVAYVVAARQPDGTHALVLHDAAHAELARIPVSARAHGFARAAGRPDRLVVFARRPGTEAWVLDLAERRLA